MSHMTVYLVIFLPKVPYIHRMYMVLANPTHLAKVHITDTSNGTILDDFQNHLMAFSTLHYMLYKASRAYKV
jgi:hypothetical protein